MGAGTWMRQITSSLNEGRDLNPGDTCRSLNHIVFRQASLNEGRDLNPGDTRGYNRVNRTPSTLNEGRDLNPGDTCIASCSLDRTTRAQRRPGPESRRHAAPASVTSLMP